MWLHYITLHVNYAGGWQRMLDFSEIGCYWLSVVTCTEIIGYGIA